MIEHRWLSLFLALSTPFLALADDSSPLSPRIRGMGGVDMLRIRDSYFLEQCSSGCVAVFCQCLTFSVQCNCMHKDETGPPDCAIDISQGDSCNTGPSNVVQACKINCDALNPDGTVRSITDSDSSTRTAFTESAVSPDPTNPADNGRGGPAGSSSATTTSADVGNEGGPAATSSETAGAAAATSHPTATSTPIVSSSSHRGGLSTGAKAGIAVGVIVGVALIAFVAFCLFRNRKKGQSPVMAEEAKTLDSDQNGPSIVHPDPYSDSPATGTGYSPDGGRFSWMQAQSPTGPLASGGVAVAAAAAAPAATSPTAQNAHASRDMSEQDGAAYWQRSSAHMSNPPQESLAGVPAAAAAPRSSLQHERSPSAASSPTYTAYSPPVQQPATSAAAAPAAAQDAPPEHEWDDDERRLEAEMAEIDRMRQLRDERAALG